MFDRDFQGSAVAATTYDGLCQATTRLVRSSLGSGLFIIFVVYPVYLTILREDIRDVSRSLDQRGYYHPPPHSSLNLVDYEKSPECVFNFGTLAILAKFKGLKFNLRCTVLLVSCFLDISCLFLMFLDILLLEIKVDKF